MRAPPLGNRAEGSTPGRLCPCSLVVTQDGYGPRRLMSSRSAFSELSVAPAVGMSRRQAPGPQVGAGAGVTGGPVSAGGPCGAGRGRGGDLP